MLRWKDVRLPIVTLAVALFLALICALNFTRIMGRSLDHDEHQFVAAGVMLARNGLLPYLDYAYFHVPALVFVYAILFQEATHLLLAARSFSAVCSSLLLITLFGFALRLFTAHDQWRRTLIAAAAPLLLMAAPVFLYTSGRAWNHDLPTLLALLAFLIHVQGLNAERQTRWFGLSGLLIGLAAATRLSLAPIALPLAVAIWLWPQALTPGRRIRGLLAFGIGAMLGSLPTLIFLAADPASFWFGNFEYARLNTLYREVTGYDRRMSIPGKLVEFAWNNLLYEPGNLLILAAYLRFGLPWRVRDQCTRAWLMLLGGVILALTIGVLAPTPAWPQYYYVLFPFFVLGALFGLGHNNLSELESRWLPWAASAALILAFALTGPEYTRLPRLLQPEKWNPVQFHTSGQQIAALAGSDARVLSLAAALPLEGGSQIYPELTTGPFALRAGRFTQDAERARLRLIDPDRLDEWLTTQPPHAVLTGVHRSQSVDEEPLTTYAQGHGYIPLTLDDATLWLAPRAVWADAIQLVTVVGAPAQVKAGETITPVLFLQSLAPLSDDLNVTVRIVSQSGEAVAQSMGWPWGRPTSTWQLHEIWYDGHSLRLPQDAIPGLYRIEMEFYSPTQAQLLTATDLRSGATLSSPYVIAYVSVGASLPPDRPLTGPPQFGYAATLTGYDLAGPSPLHGGETVRLRLHWRTLGSLPADYTTFVHLVSPTGELTAQHDQQPLNGFFPTSAWRSNQTFVDDFELLLPASLTPGPYTLYVGFYAPDTGERLTVRPAPRGGDRLSVFGNRLFPTLIPAPPPAAVDAWPLTSLIIEAR